MKARLELIRYAAEAVAWHLRHGTPGSAAWHARRLVELAESARAAP